ncbi:hypothetical protein MJ904_26225 [Massilia sp. MB5]|uniref:hypothetical protein n=1 Tax=Massilia sp. MB5 TaxID=2919578 RepID=UPI001F10A365|nr:hypothetical protein [Massilia sp. MB5]UMR30432.1 hypothetical protein MJ904_26225 [Massilia sp. MB5]
MAGAGIHVDATKLGYLVAKRGWGGAILPGEDTNLLTPYDPVLTKKRKNCLDI